jgi:hypothetical protein
MWSALPSLIILLQLAMAPLHKNRMGEGGVMVSSQMNHDAEPVFFCFWPNFDLKNMILANTEEFCMGKMAQISRKKNPNRHI